ncbi:hypothetical protein PAPYR_6558 [Paratrimastix pyriformis]|uniref:Uncharacterized protein n=1 Tax=Paratrimastix pyriformis TaxID=342808 RepID=A0ABQ8UKP9_9EUKA|nr:hypothetical protein PAPYR_6558 [Paratrimastix pyriformis]
MLGWAGCRYAEVEQRLLAKVQVTQAQRDQSRQQADQASHRAEDSVNELKHWVRSVSERDLGHFKGTHTDRCSHTGCIAKMQSRALDELNMACSRCGTLLTAASVNEPCPCPDPDLPGGQPPSASPANRDPIYGMYREGDAESPEREQPALAQPHHFIPARTAPQQPLPPAGDVDSSLNPLTSSSVMMGASLPPPPLPPSLSASGAGRDLDEAASLSEPELTALLQDPSRLRAYRRNTYGASPPPEDPSQPQSQPPAPPLLWEEVQPRRPPPSIFDGGSGEPGGPLAVTAADPSLSCLTS